jgi:hypothetical protein
MRNTGTLHAFEVSRKLKQILNLFRRVIKQLQKTAPSDINTHIRHLPSQWICN